MRMHKDLEESPIRDSPRFLRRRAFVKTLRARGVLRFYGWDIQQPAQQTIRAVLRHRLRTFGTCPKISCQVTNLMCAFRSRSKHNSYQKGYTRVDSGWSHLLHTRTFLRNRKPLPKYLNLLPRPTERKQCLFMRSAILHLRPISARRFDDAKPLAAFPDRNIAHVEGRGNCRHRFSPYSKQQFIGIDLKLSLPRDAAFHGAGCAPDHMRRADINGSAAYGTIDCFSHNHLTGR